MKSKFPTSTVSKDGSIVPWLAAEGPLSYSPENPPEREYFFKYNWILPGIFNETVNIRELKWFGELWSDDPDVQFLRDFWKSARKGQISQVCYCENPVEDESCKAPVAVYRHKDRHIIIQHGSYQILDDDCFSGIDSKGQVFLFRGIGKEEKYTLFRLGDQDTRINLMKLHQQTLWDSVISFNSMHCNLVRCETWFLNDKSFLLGKLAEENGLNTASDSVLSMLYSGYSFSERLTSFKFGPAYVKFRTPISNIRITTFFAGENEVKVIDPNKLEVVEANLCDVVENII